MERDALLEKFRSTVNVAAPNEHVAKVAEGKGQPALRPGGTELGHSCFPPLDGRIDVTLKP
jgi:hypothetical protein